MSSPGDKDNIFVQKYILKYIYPCMVCYWDVGMTRVTPGKDPEYRIIGVTMCNEIQAVTFQQQGFLIMSHCFISSFFSRVSQTPFIVNTALK